jgi:hypothetical protein
VSWFAVALAFLLVGCSQLWAERLDNADEQPPAVCERTFFVRPGFSEEQRARIDRATRRWNSIADEKFCTLDNDSAEGPEILPLAYPSEEYDRLRDYFKTDYTGAHWKAWGSNNEQHDVIVIRVDIDDDMFEVTAMHELGHAHGLGHIEEPGIMSNQEFRYTITVGDLKECRRVGACK